MLSHLAQVQRQRRKIVQGFSKEFCPYHESIVSQDALTFYALLYSNVLVLYHQRFFLHCYHFIHQPFVIRSRLIITVVPLDVHNKWSTYTKSGIGGVQVTSLHHDPIEVDNRSSGAKFSNNIKYKRNYIIKSLFSII